MKVILFNGPAGSGKDECTKLAQKFCDKHGIQNKHIMFKEQLFRLVLVVFNIDRGTFFELYDNRITKEQPTELLKGYSPRQALIMISETMIKPVLGKTYFGDIAAQRLEGGVNIFSDSGFVEELEPVYKACSGALTIVRVHREGYTFEGDSRSYLSGYLDCPVVDLYNDGSLEKLEQTVQTLVKEELALEYQQGS